MKKAETFLFIDGSSQGNPGPGGAGFVIVRGNKIIKEGGKYLGNVTNNEAEYKALILGLEELKKANINKVTIKTDSELLYYQVKGVYRVKAKNLKPLFKKVRELLKELSWKIERISREENKRADKLANVAARGGILDEENNN